MTSTHSKFFIGLLIGLLVIASFIAYNALETVSYANNRPDSNAYNILASSASYIVFNDGKGNYQVLNCTDGSIVAPYTSTSANTTINKAITLGGTIAIKSGNYAGAQLNVPGNATIVAESGTTGIKYASIADGARISEPDFNNAFGAYNSGSYTVATNETASATTATWYLAFKPDNSIYFASTNSSYVINSAVQATKTGTVYIEGIINVPTSIVLTMPKNQYTSITFNILIFTQNNDGLVLNSSSISGGNEIYYGKIQGNLLETTYPNYAYDAVKLQDVGFANICIGEIYATNWGTIDSTE